MNVFINENNYLSRYLKLVCFGMDIDITNREREVLEYIAERNKFYKSDKSRLCTLLGVSPYSIANTLKSLKDRNLITKFKVDDILERMEYGSYFYKCSFSTPNNINQLMHLNLPIIFTKK